MGAAATYFCGDIRTMFALAAEVRLSGFDHSEAQRELEFSNSAFEFDLKPDADSVVRACRCLGRRRPDFNLSIKSDFGKEAQGLSPSQKVGVLSICRP
jgi:hypothetical protein